MRFPMPAASDARRYSMSFVTRDIKAPLFLRMEERKRQAMDVAEQLTAHVTHGSLFDAHHQIRLEVVRQVLHEEYRQEQQADALERNERVHVQQQRVGACPPLLRQELGEVQARSPRIRGGIRELGCFRSLRDSGRRVALEQDLHERRDHAERQAGRGRVHHHAEDGPGQAACVRSQITEQSKVGFHVSCATRPTGWGVPERR